MTSNIYGVGLRNVGSYQVAGTPYLTASNLSNEEKLFEFPNVTKKIVVENRYEIIKLDGPASKKSSLRRWFSQEFIKNNQEYRDRGGKFIIPIPTPKII